MGIELSQTSWELMLPLALLLGERLCPLCWYRDPEENPRGTPSREKE